MTAEMHRPKHEGDDEPQPVVSTDEPVTVEPVEPEDDDDAGEDTQPAQPVTDDDEGTPEGQ